MSSVCLAKETWTGSRAGVEGAQQEFGAEAAFPVEEFTKKFPDIARDTGALLRA